MNPVDWLSECRPGIRHGLHKAVYVIITVGVLNRKNYFESFIACKTSKITPPSTKETLKSSTQHTSRLLWEAFRLARALRDDHAAGSVLLRLLLATSIDAKVDRVLHATGSEPVKLL